jgi:hypothetical protein
MIAIFILMVILAGGVGLVSYRLGYDHGLVDGAEINEDRPKWEGYER